MWLDLTTSRRQTWLFSSTSTYHSTDLVTARGVAHLVVQGTTGSTSYETIPAVRLETSGDVRGFIFHTATTLEQAHSRNTKLEGLPERHLAHQSWPPVLSTVDMVVQRRDGPRRLRDHDVIMVA